MVNKKNVVFDIAAEYDGQRLDKTIRAQFPEWGRKAVGRAISNRQVRVNGQLVWMSSWKVHTGNQIEVSDPPRPRLAAPVVFDPSWLLSDEDDLLVVLKPAGLRSQGTRAGEEDNLLSLIQKAFGEDLRLFHRLDRDTSGLCILTRPGSVNAYLDRAFQNRMVKKEYLALVSNRGNLEKTGLMRDYLDKDPKRRDKMVIVPKGGKVAFTDYKVMEEEAAGFRVALYPQTGRTHQLRVQLAGRGAAVIGDRLYGGKQAERMMLHASRIVLPEEGEISEREWVCEAEF